MPIQFDQQTILLVEDEDFSRSLVSQTLRRIGFADVLVAEDGRRAVDILNTRKVHIVLSDLRMPGLNGLQLLKMVRTGQTRAPRNLPCAMLTSYADRQVVGLAIVLDINTFLAKPASMEALTKRLSHCFQYHLEPLSVSAYEAVDVDHTAQAEEAKAAPAPNESADEFLPVDELDEELAEKTKIDARGDALEDAATFTKPQGKKTEGKKTEAAPQKPAETKQPVRAAAPSEPTTSSNKRVVKVALSDVPENAVLAKNLMGSSGTLLLGSGTKFKARYIRRLEELSSIDEKIEHVWIYEE